MTPPSILFFDSIKKNWTANFDPNLPKKIIIILQNKNIFKSENIIFVYFLLSFGSMSENLLFLNI